MIFLDDVFEFAGCTGGDLDGYIYFLNYGFLTSIGWDMGLV